MDELGNLESLTAQHNLKDFSCGKSALDSWLIKYALINQESGSTKTFVLPTIAACGGKVVAFYSLVAGAVLRSEALPGITKSTPKTQSVPVVILARLAVSEEYQKAGLGKALMKDALKRCLEVSRHIGFRAVLVHAKTEEAAAFYQKKFDFEPSPTNPLHLMLPIQDIAKAFK